MADNHSVFIDTNILIYANISDSPFHEQAISKVEKLQEEGVDIYINRQVLREYLATMTRPGNFTEEVSKEAVIKEIRKFEESFIVLDEKPETTKQLLELVSNFSVAGKQIHDANIVATMIIHNVPTLLTNNTSDFKRFNDKIQLIVLED